jgi:nitrite reductase/ring-hydroxylating ferredoxin subunit
MNDQDPLNQALEELLTDHSPRHVASGLDQEEQQMVRMAQLLRGTRGGEPSPVFRQALAERLAREPRRISRRTAFFTTAGALAAGLLAGLGLDRFFSQGNGGGNWVQVASADTLREGDVHPFKAGDRQGFLVKKGGRLSAVSRLCTDVGCPLNYQKAQHALVCPCHGAEFDLHGVNMVGAGPYATPLPPLPAFEVQVEGNAVKVWTG